MRSLRTMSCRSPTRSSSARDLGSSTSGVATSAASVAGSGPNDAANVWPMRGVRARAPRAPTPGTPGPSARCGSRWCSAAIDEQIAWATYSGSTRTELGPQNGVWVKCTTWRSGRALAHHLRDERRAGSPARAPVSPSAGDVDHRVGERRGSPRRSPPTPRGSGGRSGAGGRGRTARGAGTRGRRSRRRRSAGARRRGRAASSWACTPPAGVGRARRAPRRGRRRRSRRRPRSRPRGWPAAA